jgi:DNA-directed RNA polymerase subunit RPC12/RpoP
MFSFCPHCGGDIGQEQVSGQVVVCKHCGQQIGVVAAAPKPVVIDQAEELIRQGKAARCPLCAQLVELKGTAAARTFVPHFTSTPARKACPNSGKPQAPPPKKPPAGKDLSTYMTRDLIRVVSYPKDADPRIEELTLEYLDKADRVRLQIDALRDLLGPTFRMGDYPPALQHPEFAVWSHGAACVVARRHEHGGYQTLTDTDIGQVVADLKQHRRKFFP